MSEENNKKLYDHYTNVINGNVKSGNPVRDDLNVSDAKRHLADLIEKNPNLAKEEAPKQEEEAPKETKSKKEK